jgi:hypothetical protein
VALRARLALTEEQQPPTESPPTVGGASASEGWDVTPARVRGDADRDAAVRSAAAGSEELESIVVRGSRAAPSASPDQGASPEPEPSSTRREPPVSAPSVTERDALAAEETIAAEGERLLYRHRGDASAGSASAGAEGPEQWVRRRLEAEAAAAAARIRSTWTSEPAVSPTADEGTPAPSATVRGSVSEARRRLEELGRESAREERRIGEFLAGGSSTEGAAETLSPPPDLPTPADSAAGGDLLEAQRLRIAERCRALLERIITDTKASARAVGRPLGYDVRFDGTGPNRTEELREALGAFYRRTAATTKEAGG